MAEETLSLSCPHCNGKLKIPSSLSGQVVDCPHCAKQLTTPGAPPAQSPAVPSSQPATSPRPATSPQKAQNRPGNVITLEGPTTPNLPLNPGEVILLDIAQGFRDLGLEGLILRHKGRLIVTNQRSVAFRKKTKDFDIQQLNMRHTGFISLSHRLNFIPFLLGLMLILGSISGMGAAANMRSDSGFILLPCLIMLIAGIIVVFTAKVQSLVLSGSGEKISFKTKSVSADVLAKVLTAISANS